MVLKSAWNWPSIIFLLSFLVFLFFLFCLWQCLLLVQWTFPFKIPSYAGVLKPASSQNKTAPLSEVTFCAVCCKIPEIRNFIQGCYKVMTSNPPTNAPRSTWSTGNNNAQWQSSQIKDYSLQQLGVSCTSFCLVVMASIIFGISWEKSVLLLVFTLARVPGFFLPPFHSCARKKSGN